MKCSGAQIVWKVFRVLGMKKKLSPFWPIVKKKHNSELSSSLINVFVAVFYRRLSLECSEQVLAVVDKNKLWVK